MSKFVSDELQKVDLGDGEWIKIPKEIAFEDLQTFSKGGTDNFEQTLTMLEMFIKEWNFKDDKKQPVELNKENIKRLKVQELTEIQQHIMKIMPNMDKKKQEPESANSPKQSKEKAVTKPGSTT